MRLVILEAESLGKDMDLSGFSRFGEVTVYEKTTEEECPERVREADIVICNKVRMCSRTLSGAENLKLICVTATGINNIDLDYVKRHNIAVTNVAGYSTVSVAQHTFAMYFYLAEKLRYYDDYIRSERQKGRSEADIMDELGDPRLIARTILDTTPGAAEGEYEEYHPFSSFAGNSGRSSQQENAQQTQSGGYSGSGNIHYYDLNKWYWKVLAVVIVILFFTLVLTIIGGILTLLIPLLPVIGIVALVMWLVRGPRG